MQSINTLLSFIHLSNEVSAIKRFIHKPGTDHTENLAEHSYQLAMSVWYLIESDKLDLDASLAMKYALVHDLVEVHTGDFPTHEPDFDEEKKAEKQRLEHESFLKLCERFPNAQTLWEIYEQYEKRDDPESKFVYALDKLMPMANIYLDNGEAWRIWDAAFAHLDQNYSGRINVSPEVDQYWQELRKLIIKNCGEYFPDKPTLKE